MARVNVAKSVLLDRETRATYDRLRALRRPVARVAAAHPPHVARHSYRSAHTTVGRHARSSAVDRTTGVLLLLVLPLLGALLLYVFQAVQLVGQPVRVVSSDLALSPGGRPNTTSAADVVWQMVHGSPPSADLARRVNNFIGSRRDRTPEGELLVAVGSHLQQAGSANDAAGWQQAVAEVCSLATRC